MSGVLTQCHDARVLHKTLASWLKKLVIVRFSVTTHDFSPKLLRRGKDGLVQMLFFGLETVSY